jgi:uncharacterized protein YcfJ
MKKSVLTLTVLAAAVSAHAQQALVTARVLSAQPVVQQVPVSDCGGGRPNGGGAAVGALAGGLAGSQIGRGHNGQIASTMIGAIGGAILGNAVEASQSRNCATRYSQQVIGYDVVYEHAGRQYMIRMDRQPGRWLQVPAPDAYYAEPPPEYDEPPYDQPDAQPPAVVMVPPPVYAPAYPQPYYYPPQQVNPDAPPYPAYPAPPMYVRPAPMYVAPSVGVGVSIGGPGRHHGHGGVSFGIGFGRP